MKQLTIIEKLQEVFPKFNKIKAAVLIGSFARKDASGKSDIDYSLWVEDGFDANGFADALADVFKGSVTRKLYIPKQHRIVVYFSDCPKLEMVVYHHPEDMVRNYLGSEIKDINHSLQYVRPNLPINLCKFFAEKCAQKKESAGGGLRRTIVELIDEFAYRFESASAMHNRSDAFRFYFLYNIALDTAIRLAYLADGESKFLYQPRYFSARYKTEGEREEFYALAGSLFLSDANTIKRRLLEFFYKSVRKAGVLSDEEFIQLKSFLEIVYQRDYMWNFRDVALNNPIFKKGKVYRTSSLTRYQNEPFFADFIKNHHIKTIIDLRDDDECEAAPYTDEAKKMVNYIHLKIDPREQSDEFRRKYHYGTNNQIAYRHYAVEHRHIFKDFFEKIDLNDGAIAIHCNAGKDRTGCVIALLSLALGSDIEHVYEDYLYSEMDSSLETLNEFLEIVNKEGGAKQYLMNCGVPIERIIYWIENLKHN